MRDDTEKMNNKMKKILVVDDSRGWLDFHKSALNEIYGAEFAVSTANSAQTGYDVVYNNMNEPFDIIITDLQMELSYEPQHAGEWLVERIKELTAYKKTKIIIVSASYNIRSVARRLDVNFLPKISAAKDLNTYKLAIDELIK